MTCFIEARCCIKYRIHVLYNSLNKHTRYIEYQSHPPPKYTLWLSHPPLSKESPASRRKMRVLRGAGLARDDWPLLYDKLAMSNTYSHVKNCSDPRPITLSKWPSLKAGFPRSPSWEAGDCSHLPPMAHRAMIASNLGFWDLYWSAPILCLIK